MDTIFISIGCCCGSAMLLQNKHLRITSMGTEVSLPFDWIISHLDFVHDVIVTLYTKSLEESFDIFYDPTNLDVFCAEVYCRGNPADAMLYRTVTSKWDEWDGKFIYNRNYKISFCHDKHRNANTEKMYKRRLQLFKDFLLDQNEFLRFVYTDAGSRETQYQINGEILNENAGEKLNKLAQYLSSKRKYFDIIWINSMEDPIAQTNNLNKKIKRIPVNPRNNFYPMITENVIVFPELTEYDYI